MSAVRHVAMEWLGLAAGCSLSLHAGRGRSRGEPPSDLSISTLACGR
jgi:hypothetical protein